MFWDNWWKEGSFHKEVNHPDRSKLFTKKETAQRGEMGNYVQRWVIMSTRGFTRNTGPWNGTVGLETERRSQSPEWPHRLVQPLQKTISQRLLELHMHRRHHPAIPFPWKCTHLFTKRHVLECSRWYYSWWQKKSKTKKLNPNSPSRMDGSTVV